MRKTQENEKHGKQRLDRRGKEGKKYVNLGISDFISKLETKGVFIATINVKRKVHLNPSPFIKSQIDVDIEYTIDEEITKQFELGQISLQHE